MSNLLSFENFFNFFIEDFLSSSFFYLLRCDRQQLWKAVYHPKKAWGEIWPKRSERRNTKTTKMRTKSPQWIKKINSQIKKPHLKMIPIKDNYSVLVFILNISLWVFLATVGWGCRIHRLHLCRGVRLQQQVPWIRYKQSDGEASVMPELWGTQCTPSLSSFSSQLWSGVVAPDRVLSIRLQRTVSHISCVLVLNWIVWKTGLYGKTWRIKTD